MSIIDDDWLVADSEDDEAFLPGVTGQSSIVLNNLNLTETSEIQTATFSPPQARTPEWSRLSPNVSGESLFTPPPDESGPSTDPDASISFPRVTEEVILTKPNTRPRPRIRKKTVDTSRLTNEDLAQSGSARIAGTSFSHISDPWTSAKLTEDSIQPAPATSSVFSDVIGDPYSSLAERAKMRSRKPKKPTYRQIEEDVIELTSDDEIALQPSKRQKKHDNASSEARSQPKARPKPKPRVKAANTTPGFQPSGAANPNQPEAPAGSASSNPPPASTVPTIPPSTPPIPPETSPLSSPAIVIRKRKRHRPSVAEDDLNVDADALRQFSPSIAEPPPFFAPSSSVQPSDSGIEIPAVHQKSSNDRNKKRDTAKEGSGVKARSRGKKGKGKMQNEDEFTKESLQTTADLSAAGSASIAGEATSDVNGAPKSKNALKPRARRKGKGKAIMSDEEDGLTVQATAAVSPETKGNEPTASTPVLDDEERPQGSTSKENMPPDDANLTKHGDELKTPAATIHSRALSVKPKSTPMSELIRRVNSQPHSPFPNVSRPYSPWLKSSRTMLSNIAPLHPNRRTPPPPLPRPPPPKKTKKRIEMEERIEEELAETIEGWSCMTDEERRDLRRARIDAELGYE